MFSCNQDEKGNNLTMWSWHEEQCANMIKTGKFPEPEGWYRSCGDCICEVCKRNYYSHPVHIPYWSLRVLCNGDFVHL